MMPSKDKLYWATVQVVMYTRGSIYSVRMSMGERAWHVPTTSSFHLALPVQVLWLVRALGPGRVHVD